MCLNYYLLCKNKFESIITNLTEIIEKYEDVFSYENMYEMLDSKYILNSCEYNNKISQLNLLLNHAKDCKNYCHEKIKKLCIHEFVNDTIDISPEKSKNITYCKICEYTLI